MGNLVIEHWYKFCSETLYLHGLINTIPELQLTKVKKYKGKIVRKGDNFLKIRINDLSYNIFDHTDLIHTICHELAHMHPDCWNHSAEHSKLTEDYAQLVYVKHRIKYGYDRNDDLSYETLKILSGDD